MTVIGLNPGGGKPMRGIFKRGVTPALHIRKILLRLFALVDSLLPLGMMGVVVILVHGYHDLRCINNTRARMAGIPHHPVVKPGAPDHQWRRVSIV